MKKNEKIISTFSVKNLEHISRGNFGSVSKGTFEGKQVAVKVYADLSEDFPDEGVIREVSCLSRLRGVPHIAQLLGVDFKKKMLMMDYYPSNLKIFIQTNPDRMNYFDNILQQLLKGLIYMNERGIIHADIKPANILIDEKKNVYYADFGISVVYPCKESLRVYRPDAVSSLYYRAPEFLVNKDQDVSGTADTWSLGCILCEYITGEVYLEGTSVKDQLDKIISNLNYPIEKYSQKEIIEKISKFDIHASENIPISKHSSLLKNCLQVNPQDRISVVSLKKYVEKFEEVPDSIPLKRGEKKSSIDVKNYYNEVINFKDELLVENEKYILALDMFDRIITNYKVEEVSITFNACYYISSCILGHPLSGGEFMERGAFKKDVFIKKIFEIMELLNFMPISCDSNGAFQLYFEKDPFKMLEGFRKKGIDYPNIPYKNL